MDLGLKGKTVLVTASSTGIGKAIADGFAAEGAKVAICSRSQEKLIEAAKDIKNKYGADVFWGICDLNSQKDINNFFNAVVANFGKVEILVNNMRM